MAITKAGAVTLPNLIDQHTRYILASAILAALTSEIVFHTPEGTDSNATNGIGQVFDQANKKFGTQSMGISWPGVRRHARSKQETDAKGNIQSQ